MKRLIYLLIILTSCTHTIRQPSSENSLEGQRILYIGDSFSAGYLGGYVYEHLKQKVGTNGDVNLYGVVSSSPRHWAPVKNSQGAKWLCRQEGRKNASYPTNVKKSICPKRRKNSPISHLMQAHNPHTVIFQFLGNSMGMSERGIINNVTNLIDQIDGAKCYFILSPPYHQSIDSQNAKRKLTSERFIKAIAGRCEIYNGMDEANLPQFKAERDHYAGDKKHLSRTGARVFFNDLKDLF